MPILIALIWCATLTCHATVVWHWNYAAPGYETQEATLSNSMNQCVATWNTYAAYNQDMGVRYDPGITTAQASYQGEMGFGSMYNYRVTMHESSHYMGTGTYWNWYGMDHFRWGVWNGTYAYNLRCAFDGPGEREGGDSQHYWPYGANYDSEGVDAPRMVGLIGAFRRDMGLDDQTIGIASGTYRLCNRVSTLTLDSLGGTTEGAQVSQNTTVTGDDEQLWNVSLIEGTTYFTIQNVANGLYLDSLGGANGDPVGMTTLSGSPTDNQLWSIEQTDSFYFKLVNKGTGRGIDSWGDLDAGAGMKQYDAAGNGNWNQQWTFKHQYAQTMPEAGVISQGRPVAASSYDSTYGTFYPEKGNNGVEEDRWTASDGTYPQWWYVDTGLVQPISKVEVDWFPGGVFQYQIEVSDDASTWTVVADRTSNASTGTTVDHLSGVNARFVRINFTGTTTGGWAAFMECRVYNETEGMKLLSLNRPCTASSEQLGNLAVNANNVDSIFTRWCAASSGYPAWWQVDLGTTQQVNRAVIAWFDDNTRYYQYKIEGSIDGVNYTTLVDRTGNTSPYTTVDTFSGEARYVRVTVTGGSDGWPSFYDAQIYSATNLVDVPPAAPSGLTASSGDGYVALDWADNSEPDWSSYTVYRSTTSGSGYSIIASNLTASAYTNNAVSNGTTYYYVVTATDTNSNESTYSAEVLAHPGIVSQVALNNGDFDSSTASTTGGFDTGGYDVPGWTDYGPITDSGVGGSNDWWAAKDGYAAWMAPGDGAYTMSTYTIQAGDVFTIDFYAMQWEWTGSGQWTATLFYDNPANAIGTFVQGSLPNNGTWNEFTSPMITASPASVGHTLGILFTSTGTGIAQVDEITVKAISVPPDTTPPSVPTGLGASVGDSSVDLGWATNSEPDLAGYAVYRSTTSGSNYAPIASGLGSSAYTDHAVTNGTVYYYVVTAADSNANESAYSSEISAVPSVAVSSNEFFIADPAVTGGTNLSLTVLNSVLGHQYTLKATDTLMPPAWSNIVVVPGTGSNLLFGIPITGTNSNRYFKLDVQRQ